MNDTHVNIQCIDGYQMVAVAQNWDPADPKIMCSSPARHLFVQPERLVVVQDRDQADPEMMRR